MELEEAIFGYLTSLPEITALIGTRIYPVFVPQDVIDPVMVFARTGTQPTTEPDLQDDPLMDARVEMTVWGVEYPKCKAAMTAIRRALADKETRGDMGVGCQNVVREDQADVFDQDLKLVGVRALYLFTFDDD